MIVKKLLRAWQGEPAGATVVIPERVHEELLDTAVVGPTCAVRALRASWRDPDGVVLPVGSRLELDEATRDQLATIGVLGATVHEPDPCPGT